MAMLLGVLGCPQEMDRIERQLKKERLKEDDENFREKVSNRTKMWLAMAETISKGP